MCTRFNPVVVNNRCRSKGDSADDVGVGDSFLRCRTHLYHCVGDIMTCTQFLYQLLCPFVRPTPDAHLHIRHGRHHNDDRNHHHHHHHRHHYNHHHHSAATLHPKKSRPLLFLLCDYVKHIRTVLLSRFCPSVRLSNACIVTKRKHLAKKVQL